VLGGGLGVSKWGVCGIIRWVERGWEKGIVFRHIEGNIDRIMRFSVLTK
jgi:hypothetical protein